MIISNFRSFSIKPFNIVTYDVMKHTYNITTFTNENEISYYLLGAFMTDGCIQSNNGIRKNSNSWMASISSKDLDWIEIIRDHICPTLPIHKTYNKLSITNTEISKWFISKGCVPKKSLILDFPKVPDKFISDFIRGCLDGDGSFSGYKNKRSASAYICSASKDFLLGIQTALKKFDIHGSIHKINKKSCKIGSRVVIPKHDHFRLIFSTKQVFKLLMFIYFPEHKISMPRKNQKANEILKNRYEYEVLNPQKSVERLVSLCSNGWNFA